MKPVSEGKMEAFATRPDQGTGAPSGCRPFPAELDLGQTGDQPGGASSNPSN